MSSGVISQPAAAYGRRGQQPQAVRSQAELIRKNVAALIEAQRSEAGQRTTLDRVSDAITNFSGSMTFVLIHVVWFGAWVLLNVGLLRVPHLSGFDPFPFGLLTMIVSLEAIFLSTFVLISQNRQARLSERRAELDLHVNLLAEQKATKALELLDQITQQLNSLKRFDFRHDPEVEALKVSPEPQEVLDVMQETVQREAEKLSGKVEQAVDEITGEVEAMREEVEDITGETEAVHAKVESMDQKMEAVAQDVEGIKEEIAAPAGAREERVTLK